MAGIVDHGARRVPVGGGDRKSGGEGKRVELGGGRIIKKKKKNNDTPEDSERNKQYGKKRRGCDDQGQRDDICDTNLSFNSTDSVTIHMSAYAHRRYWRT